MFIICVLCLHHLQKNLQSFLIWASFSKMTVNSNLHHSHWERWRCFSQHAATDSLLNIVTNAKLKLLLKSDIIMRKIHNQFTIIDLIFSSEKIQFMTCKCKIRMNLHQELNHLSIIMKLCLQTISVQFQHDDYERKWTWKHWAHICICICRRVVIWIARQR